jgi:hypothetical protein
MRIRLADRLSHGFVVGFICVGICVVCLAAPAIIVSEGDFSFRAQIAASVAMAIGGVMGLFAATHME